MGLGASEFSLKKCSRAYSLQALPARQTKRSRLHKLISKSAFSLCMALASAVTTLPVTADDADTRPIVYLTFDDGPSADNITEQVLELLAQHNAKATFFLTGQRVRKNGAKIPAILYAGHAIGNHTFSHVKLTDTSSDEIVKEFKSASQAVIDAGGPPLTCFRPPFGSTDQRVNSIAAELGMVAVKWSLDTRDWDSLVHLSTIYETLDRSSNGSIVLMHDGPARRGKTLMALSAWMAVSAHRYQFNALPDCQPYGSGEQFASYDEQELDLNVEPETLQSLLVKLRSYRFSLQSKTAHRSPEINEQRQLSAKLDVK